MLFPAAQAVEQYYALFNRRHWRGIAAMFDLPAMIIVGPRKVLLETLDAVTAVYQGIGDKFDKEGVVRLSWERARFVIFPVHDDLTVVKTVLTREGADGPIKTWNCSYTARCVGMNWRFTLGTSDDATNAAAW